MQALVDLVFVNRRLEVRFLSPAPYHTSCDPRAIHRFIATRAPRIRPFSDVVL